MKKLLLAALAAIAVSSCGVQTTVIPKAVNTINSVSLDELNLEGEDYTILNTISAEAVITYESTFNAIKMADENNEFSLNYYKTRKGWKCRYTGILKFGYLSNDYVGYTTDIIQPEDVARRLAIYRLINMAQLDGSDGLIEPVIATSLEQSGKQVVFKTTVTAKTIKIKTDN